MAAVELLAPRPQAARAPGPSPRRTLPAGTYAFTATDTTSAGTSTTSSPFDLTVPPPSSPTLNSVAESPSSGDFNAGKTVTLTLAMSDNVTVNTAGGTPH